MLHRARVRSRLSWPVAVILFVLVARPGTPGRISGPYAARLLARLPPAWSVAGPLLVDPEGDGVAFSVCDGRRWAVLANGDRGPWHDAVRDLAFGPDGRTLWYVARDGDRERLVRDHVPLEPGGRRGFTEIGPVAVSADGRRAAAGACDGAAGFVVNGDEVRLLAPGEAVTDLWFSTSGTLVTVTAGAKERHVYLDGRRDPAFDAVPPDYSVTMDVGEGRRAVYLARSEAGDAGVALLAGRRLDFDGVRSRDEAEGDFLFCGRREGRIERFRVRMATLEVESTPLIDLPEGVTDWDVDPSGATVAWVRTGEEGSRLVLAGAGRTVEDPWFDEVDLASLAFDAGGRRAYRAVREGREHLVVDGRPGPGFDAIERVGFGPGGVPHARGSRGERQFALVGEAVVPPRGGEEVRTPQFSADGAAWTLRLRDRAGWRVATRGGIGEAFQAVEPPVVSASGTVVAYVARRAGEDLVVVNGRVADRADLVLAGPLTNGRRVAYAALAGRDLEWRVLDVE